MSYPTPSELETPTQLSTRTGISYETLKKWRARGEGPPWFRLGPMLIFYRRSEVDAWIESQRARPDARFYPTAKGAA